jgi:hypothetical protein
MSNDNRPLTEPEIERLFALHGVRFRTNGLEGTFRRARIEWYSAKYSKDVAWHVPLWRSNPKGKWPHEAMWPWTLAEWMALIRQLDNIGWVIEGSAPDWHWEPAATSPDSF